jgi:hypothetical protein
MKAPSKIRNLFINGFYGIEARAVEGGPPADRVMRRFGCGQGAALGKSQP